jgi:hypothetical protein
MIIIATKDGNIDNGVQNEIFTIYRIESGTSGEIHQNSIKSTEIGYRCT